MAYEEIFSEGQLESTATERSYDPELARFNAQIALFMSGGIPALRNEPRPDDDPDSGEPARLLPPDVPPHLSSIALRPPEQEPLVDLVAA